MSTTPPTDDLYAQAMNPDLSASARHYFGEVVIVDLRPVKLIKGVGKQDWDATFDPIADRKIEIKLQVECTNKDGQPYPVDQAVMDFSREWTKHTLPSLRAIGLTLRDLKGRFVQCKRQSTGETYTNKTGEIKDKTAIVFERVFFDRNEMQAAADALYTSRGTPAPAAVSTPVPSANAAERKFAEDALGMLWTSSGQNVDAFLGMIRNNPMINQHFTPSSPEVVAYTQQGNLPF